jgi:hypothetical protein
MKLLAVGHPRLGVNVATAIPPLARAELMVVLELYRTGVIREMYSRAEPGAVLVLETPTVDIATAALARQLKPSGPIAWLATIVTVTTRVARRSHRRRPRTRGLTRNSERASYRRAVVRTPR